MTRIRARARRRAATLLADELARLKNGTVLVTEYPLTLGARWGWREAPLLGITELFERSSPRIEAIVADIALLDEWAADIPRYAPDGAITPCWENDWWGTVDALAQVALLRKLNPESYVEIGSGYSTLFARRAIEDFDLRTKIISIDPHPRTWVESVCDESIRRPFQSVAPDLAGRIGEGDVVLLDGSHIAQMGTDASVFLLETLPALPAGVTVGIDDVFLPWDYPPTWEGRGYSEQYVLAGILAGGASGWEVTFPAWWTIQQTRLAAPLAALWPRIEARFGRTATSFWMQRVG
jgi:Methyltransferase domain